MFESPSKSASRPLPRRTERSDRRKTRAPHPATSPSQPGDAASREGMPAPGAIEKRSDIGPNQTPPPKPHFRQGPLQLRSRPEPLHRLGL